MGIALVEGPCHPFIDLGGRVTDCAEPYPSHLQGIQLSLIIRHIFPNQ
jgi:hypothetical protein